MVVEKRSSQDVERYVFSSLRIKLRGSLNSFCLSCEFESCLFQIKVQSL